MSLLSIIVPVYNSEKHLKECLDSLINQTYKNIEIICVNDGSTDNSLNILNEYAKKDNRIKIFSKENGGMASARNLGYKFSSGDLITFIDSDDYLELDTYKTAINTLGNNDLLCFGIKTFGKHNDKQKINDDIYYRIKYKGSHYLTVRKILRTDVSVCNKIFRKSIIDKYEVNFPENFYYEDAEFFFKYIIHCKKIYYLQEYFYNYRRSEKSIMAETFSGTPHSIDHLRIVKHIFDYYLKNNKLKRNTKLFVKIFRDYFNTAYQNSDEKTKPQVLNLAVEYALEFEQKLKIKSDFFDALKNKEYDKICFPDLCWFQKIYKTKNIHNIITNKTIKYTWLLGIKFSKIIDN